MYGEATSMNHENPVLTVPEHPRSSVVKYDTIVESVIQKFKQILKKKGPKQHRQFRLQLDP